MSTGSSQGVLTRSQSKANAAKAFKYIIEEIFDQDMDGSVAQSLLLANENVADIRKVLALTDADIDGLYYIPSSPKDDSKKPISPDKVPLGKGNKGLLRRLKHHDVYRQQKGDPI